MTKVIADITISLDGYIAPDADDSADGVVDVDELQSWVMPGLTLPLTLGVIVASIILVGQSEFGADVVGISGWQLFPLCAGVAVVPALSIGGFWQVEHDR